MYTIEPTWAQAFQWAMQRSDYWIYLGFAIACFLCFFIIMRGWVTYANWMPQSIVEDEKKLYALLFAFIIGGFTFIYGIPANIRFDNKRSVPKEIYDNPTPYWDSLLAGHHIIDGPYK